MNGGEVRRGGEGGMRLKCERMEKEGAGKMD